MDMNNLESLLRHHAEGNLTPEERKELDQLTHRDDVFHAATTRAKHLRRRQWTIASSAAALLLVVSIGGTMILRPSATPNAISSPLVVAQQMQPQTPTTYSETPLETTVKHTSKPVVKQLEPVVTDTILMTTTEGTEKTIIACNNDCTPDSVVSDIWKFLRV